MEDCYRIRFKTGDTELEVVGQSKEFVDEKFAQYLPLVHSIQEDSPMKSSRDDLVTPIEAGNKQLTLQEFIRIVKPENARRYVIAITFYYEKYGQEAEIKTSQITSALKDLKYPVKNPSDVISKAKATGYLMSGNSKGSFKTSQTGEKWVEERLAAVEDQG